MKTRIQINRCLALLLAGGLQVMPLLRAVLPAAKQIFGYPPAWASVAKLATGAVALLGYHAISSASSITISPGNATVGTPYVGTVNYSGGHAGSVSGFRVNGTCVPNDGSSIPLFPGLNIKYTGGTSAQISGTPTVNGTYSTNFTAEDFWCGGGHPYTRSASLVIGTNGGGGVAPTITAAPQSSIGQVGTDTDFSCGASGTPVPTYIWKRGVTVIPGATNSTLSLSNLTYADAGLYTVIATNSAGTRQTNCYLSVCIAPGTNQLQYAYTNFAPIGVPLTLSGFVTNVPSATNLYNWSRASGIPLFAWANNNTLTFTPNASHNGEWKVLFQSTVVIGGSNTTIVNTSYPSEWAFGSKPVLAGSPQGTNVPSGANVTFTAAATIAATPYGASTPVTFRWLRNASELVATQNLNGTNVPASLTVSNVSAANIGDYTVVVSNYWGAVTSSIATLTLTAPPVGPTNLSYSFGGGSLALSWPGSHVGWILQSQTNPSSTGLQPAPGAWFDWPGSEVVTSTNIPVNTASPTVFFRLRQP